MSLGVSISPHVLRPVDLPRSRPPLTMVCGPPGGGKSTWVKSQRAPGEPLIDVDEIYDRVFHCLGWRTPDRDRLLGGVLRARNAELRALAQSDAPAAWFIVCAPTPTERAAWRDMLGAARVAIVMPTMASTMERIDGDETRTFVRAENRAAARAWYGQYAAGQGEIVVTEAAP